MLTPLRFELNDITLEYSPSPVIYFNRKGERTHRNAAASSWKDRTTVGRYEEILPENHKTLLSQAFELKKSETIENQRRILEDGKTVLAWRYQLHPNGNTVVAYGHNVSTLHQEAEYWKRIATLDPLVGVFRKEYFLELASRRFSENLTHRQGLALAMLDLKRFGELNNTYGHLVGDQVLQAFGAFLLEAANVQDLCESSEVLIGRFGGDEFMVLMPYEKIKPFYDSLKSWLDEPLPVQSEQKLFTQFRLGYALTNMGFVTFDEFFAAAEAAQRIAKQELRGFVLYSPELRVRINLEEELKHDLRFAKELGHLQLRYEPYVELATGRIIGTEGLIQYSHPVYGDIPTEEMLLPLVRRVGAEILLLEHVFRLGLEALKRWQAEFVDANFFLSLNLEANQLDSPDFQLLIYDLMNEYRPERGTLFIELTERDKLNPAKSRTTQALREAKRLGIKLLLDDWGTQNSNLGPFLDFPTDETASLEGVKFDLKIAEKVGVGDEEADEIVTHSVRAVRARKSINPNLVIIEGVGINPNVPRDQHIAALEKVGFRIGQGHAFGGKLTEEELTDRLRKQYRA